MKIFVPNNLSLKYLYPELAHQVDRDKNPNLNPAEISANAYKYVWWRCGKGHSWRATIAQRTKVGTGCPYCSGRLATKENCLSTTNPELLLFWNFDKNLNVSPDTVKAYSNRKIWWKCAEGHEWISAISHLTNGTRCPYCSNKFVHKGNSLATNYPNVALEWHPTKNLTLTPEDVTSKSPKKYWWKCSRGHEWKVAVQKRTLDKTGCPYCSNKKVCSDNNLETLYPELIKEWDKNKNGPLKPKDYVAGSNKKVWWKCSRGHTWQAMIISRAIKGTGCPFCRPNVSKLELRIYSELIPIFKSIKRTQKLWGKEFDLIIENEKICIEVDGYPWHLKKSKKDYEKNKLCKENNFLLIRVRDDRLDKLGEFNIFYSEKDKSSHLQVITNICKLFIKNLTFPKKIKTKICHLSEATHFTNEKEYIRLLSEFPGPGFENSIEVTHPKIAAEWHPDKNGDLKTTMVSIGSGHRAWWQCSKGHEWQAYLYSRTAGGCPICSNKKVSVENSLRYKFPQVAKEWHPTKNGELTPDDVVAGSGKSVWWQCNKGHEWMRQIEKRTNYKRGCPYCANRKLPDISKYPKV